MENTRLNSFLSFLVPRSKKYVLRGIGSDQFDTLLKIIRTSRTTTLKNHLKFMPPNDAKNLVNVRNKDGATLLMGVVYYSKYFIRKQIIQ